MDQSSSQPQKYFLAGIALLGVLVIGGLLWAITLPPSENGTFENDLRFSDENDPAIGPADAAVTIRIFGDFQCPACGAAEPGVTYARKTYGDTVRFVWDDFPLVSIHLNAMAAANAARCAEDQGKFWEYHDQLYLTQTSWSDTKDPQPAFVTYAKTLGLNEGAFTSCLANQSHLAKIQADLREGTANRVEATPTFFINNKRVVGIMQNADWDREIQAQMPTSTQPLT
jgi:protein-disulfide isomerase